MKRLLFAAIVIFPLSVAAQKPLPEELAITESVVLQDKDELQSSVVLQHFKLRDAKQLTAAAQFEYGLTDRWQLEA